MHSLKDLLRRNAVRTPDRRIFSILGDDGEETGRLTYGQLDLKARALAAELQRVGGPGERVMLVYPASLDFVVAFFACAYCGMTAVPAPPPDPKRLKRTLPRLTAIAEDAAVSVLLTDSSLLAARAEIVSHSAALGRARWIATESPREGSEEEWTEPEIALETLMLLQYTSGSTAAPKGVQITHGQLLANSEYLRQAWGYGPGSVAVTWVPNFHDDGLVHGIVQPVYTGSHGLLMSPLSVVQQPVRWLRAISRYRATHAGGPNFIYAVCTARVGEQQRAGLDLSSWEVAYNAAEPIRHGTLLEFRDAFEPCGFRWESFYPAYGLAEATLLVSTREPDRLPTVLELEAESLEAGLVTPAPPGARIRTLVGCGHPVDDTRIEIVDPESERTCDSDRVGEIWIKSASLSQGYWRQEQATASSFVTRPEGSGEALYLRTGDLGFLCHGELFVTGRRKDLIILGGRNLYPQDIELSAENSHPDVRAGCCVAFSFEADEERLAIAAEVSACQTPAEEIFKAIRRAVAEEHDAALCAIRLLAPKTLPKTSSGKLQRQAVRRDFLAGCLETTASWDAPENGFSDGDSRGTRLLTPALADSRSGAGVAASLEADQIHEMVLVLVAERLGVPPRDLDPRTPFAELGLASTAAVGLSGDLGDKLSRHLSPTLLYDHPNVETLAGYLADAEPRASRRRRAERSSSQGVAIVGLACRMPGAADPDELWRLLYHGKDAVSEVPAWRWQAPSVHRWGGFLDHVELFDAGFFGLSPREAEGMDPQQRLLLEVAWEALENAAQAPRQLEGSATGVFVGISSNDYARLEGRRPEALNAYTGTGNASSIAANRLSYLLDLRGPSWAVDTACSSSLVAVHQACQALRIGECDLALAGGVNLLLAPDLTLAFSQARMLAADGRCKSFDARADGYVRGEGCGMVVLKRLRDARRDGDPIRAVIRGSAVNQDGRSNGLTAPSGLAQQQVVSSALQNAGIAPAEIRYVEAHGTGTPLGDPIEMRSLMAVLGPGRRPDQVCHVGSIKTNIGHLEAAAGIAGLIKVVLTLEQGEIPRHLHLERLNPEIPLAGEPFAIPAGNVPWPRGLDRRLAGVSSFGFGGTNAHVVLEEAPLPEMSDRGREPENVIRLLGLSARSRAALGEMAQRYAAHLDARPEISAADLCYTTGTGRSHFRHRLALRGSSTREIGEKLAGFAAGQSPAGCFEGRAPRTRPRIAFLFTGQGSQYAGMGRELYARFPRFRRTLEEFQEILRPYLERPLLAVLFGAGESPELARTSYAQPSLFAFEYALSDLWRSWGVEPAVVLGHSIGEYTAACVAGIMSAQDALRLAAARGQLMEELSPAATMVSVEAEEQRVRQAIEPLTEDLSIAALNGPNHVVLSGRREALARVVAAFSADGIRTKPLPVDRAFHSPLMEPVLDDLEKVAEAVSFAPPRIPLVSNLTGTLAGDEILGARYWRRHARQPVAFAQGMKTLREQGCDTFVEIGPKPTLCGLGRRILNGDGDLWLPSLRPGTDASCHVLEALGTLWVRGADAGTWRGETASRKIALPTYPFERRRYWSAAAIIGQRDEAPWSPLEKAKARNEGVPHPLTGRRLHVAGLPRGELRFESIWSPTAPEFFDHHRIHGTVVVPATAYVEMARSAAAEAFAAPQAAIADVHFHKALVLAPEQSTVVQLVISSEGPSASRFEIFSLTEKEGAEPAWILHASGRLPAERATLGKNVDLDQLRGVFPSVIPASELYPSLRGRGMDYGVFFQAVQELRIRPGETLTRVVWEEQATWPAEGFHPALLDACMHSATAAFPSSDEEETYLPVEIERFAVYTSPGPRLWSHARLRHAAEEASRSLSVDVDIFDDTGAPVGQVTGLVVRRIRGGVLRTALAGRQEGPARTSRTLRERWREAAETERESLLRAGLAELTSSVLGLPASELDAEQPLNEMGLDSLMAFELNNQLQARFGIDVSVVDLLEESCLTDLAAQVEAHWATTAMDAKADSSESARETTTLSREALPASRMLTELDQMSDEEVEEALAAMLASGEAVA